MTRKKKIFLIVVAVLLFVVLSPAGYIYVRYILLPPSGQKSCETAGVSYRAVAAHRGASYLAPEETEAAYTLARDLGADYLEMDAQRTKDHVLVAIHDDTPERTTNVAKVFPGREKDTIDKFTLDELKQLDAGSSFNITNPKRAKKEYAGLKILTIEEVITIAESGKNKPSIYIETKSPGRYPGYEQELVDLIKKRGWTGKFAENGRSKVLFQSFGKASLESLKALAPDIPRVYLIGKGMPAEAGGWDNLLRTAAEISNGIGPVAFIAWPWNVAKAHKAGLFVHPYTVDYPSLFSVLNFFGVDGFFTNRCDKLMEYYGLRFQVTDLRVTEVS